MQVSRVPKVSVIRPLCESCSTDWLLRSQNKEQGTNETSQRILCHKYSTL